MIKIILSGSREVSVEAELQDDQPQKHHSNTAEVNHIFFFKVFDETHPLLPIRTPVNPFFLFPNICLVLSLQLSIRVDWF